MSIRRNYNRSSHLPGRRGKIRGPRPMGKDQMINPWAHGDPELGDGWTSGCPAGVWTGCYIDGTHWDPTCDYHTGIPCQGDNYCDILWSIFGVDDIDNPPWGECYTMPGDPYYDDNNPHFNQLYYDYMHCFYLDPNYSYLDIGILGYMHGCEGQDNSCPAAFDCINGCIQLDANVWQ